jgi:hypothetical protein
MSIPILTAALALSLLLSAAPQDRAAEQVQRTLTERENGDEVQTALVDRSHARWRASPCDTSTPDFPC